MTETLLDVQDLSVVFHGRERETRAVDGVSFSIRAGGSCSRARIC